MNGLIKVNDIQIFLNLDSNEMDFFHRKVHVLNNKNILNENNLNELSWENFRECVFVIQAVMENSYTLNRDSKVIQSLFIQQVKLSKSILYLTSKQIRTGQSTLFRMIIESESTIAWLLRSNDAKRFDAYIMNGLIISNDTTNQIQKDVNEDKIESKIQKRLREASMDEYKKAGLSNDEIKEFLRLSHSRIKKQYKFPSLKIRTSFIDPSGKLYHSYTVSSGEIHSSFPEVIYQNVELKDGKFVSNLRNDINASEPRITNVVSLMLIEMFNLLDKYNVFNFNNCENLNVKRIVRLLNVLKHNAMMLDFYDEERL